MTGASADAKANQSMTHIKTVPGLTSLLEGAGVVMYVQGGATAGVIGDSLDAANSQMVFHVTSNCHQGWSCTCGQQYRLS